MALFSAAQAEQFLATCWQQRAQFLPGALPTAPRGLDWQALALRDDVESRCVLTHDATFTLLHGPFDDGLPGADGSQPFTVLIQDAEQYLPALAALIDEIDFVPRWRLEDVMLSAASAGGSVGPHVDAYDVFLVQAEGSRRWRVGETGAATPARDSGELRLVDPFDATLDVIARPGDVLYVPPGAPHHGVARESCVTLSIGFRAPSLAELATVLIEDCGPARYADPDIAVAAEAGRIDEHSIARALALLVDGLTLDAAGAARALGRLATEPKAWLMPDPADEDLTAGDLRTALAAGRSMRCFEATRVAFAEIGSKRYLFVNGETLTPPPAAWPTAMRLANRRCLTATEVADGALDLLVGLIGDGAVFLSDEG